MTFKVLALFFLVSTIAASEVETELFDLDWNNIKPANIRIDPIGPGIVEGPKLRISGGSEAQRISVPHVVALVTDTSYFCAGAIIGRLWVVTVAHCIDNATAVQIIAGAHNPRTNVDEPLQQIYLAEQKNMFKHSDWVSGRMQNDIALVRYNHIQVELIGITAIPMAPTHSQSLVGATVSLSGWGSTNASDSSLATYLQTVKLEMISNEECANSFGSVIQKEHVCTSGKGGSGACAGDSGSPLTYYDTFSETEYLVGLVSFAARPCGSGHPTVYTEMSFFRDWVQELTTI